MVIVYDLHFTLGVVLAVRGSHRTESLWLQQFSVRVSRPAVLGGSHLLPAHGLPLAVWRIPAETDDGTVVPSCGAARCCPVSCICSSLWCDYSDVLVPVWVWRYCSWKHCMDLCRHSRRHALLCSRVGGSTVLLPNRSLDICGECNIVSIILAVEPAWIEWCLCIFWLRVLVLTNVSVCLFDKCDEQLERWWRLILLNNDMFIYTCSLSLISFVDYSDYVTLYVVFATYLFNHWFEKWCTIVASVVCWLEVVLKVGVRHVLFEGLFVT